MTVVVVVGLAHQLARRMGGVRIEVHVAIQVRPRPVERRDARLIHLDQLLWRQKFGAIRPLDVGDRRLNELEPLLPTTFGRVFAVRNCRQGQRNHRQHAHHVTRQTVHTRTPTYFLNDGPACFLIRMPCTPCPHGMQWVLTRLFFGGKHGRPRPAANGHCSPAGPLVLIPKLGLHRCPAINL